MDKSTRNTYKMCTIETANGPVNIKFEELKDVEGPEELICKRCSYHNICDLLPNPKNPDDPKKSFIDFCSELGVSETEDAELINSIPAEGSLEKAFGDNESLFKVLIDKNPVVHLKDLITHVCSGWCDEYNENFSNCNECNASCILHELLMQKSKVKGTPLAKVEEKDLEKMLQDELDGNG